MPSPQVSQPRRTSTAARRRARERAILAATRSLFDERGVAEAQIEDIARAVGINRAIVYRHFTGKEELFALALVGYLDELAAALADAAAGSRAPRAQLAALVSAFVDYGVAHPAFVDCAHSLMRRTGTELFDEISEGAMLRLGRAIAACLAPLRATLEAGVTAEVFVVEDPVLLANTLYATGLGGLQLARVGLVIDEPTRGVPQVGRIGAEQVKALLLTSAVGMAQG
jgi:AcrR family transcriptional regulator